MTTRAETPMNFDDAYAFLVELEGGLLKIDAGEGIQYGGILQKWLEKDAVGFPKNILDFTPKDHKDYTQIFYWDKLLEGETWFNIEKKPKNIIRLNSLFQGVIAPIFFMAFNCGLEDAVRLAQMTSPFLKHDGILGQKTYSFLYSISDPLEWWKGSEYSDNYMERCSIHYKGQEKEKGLLNRLSKIDAWLREEV